MTGDDGWNRANFRDQDPPRPTERDIDCRTFISNCRL